MRMKSVLVVGAVAIMLCGCRPLGHTPADRPRDPDRRVAAAPAPQPPIREFEPRPRPDPRAPAVAEQPQPQPPVERRLGPQQGDWELKLGSTFLSDKSFDAVFWGIEAEVGHFVSDLFQVYVRQNLLIAHGGSTTWASITRVGANLHLDLEQWQPFVGANIGLLYVSAPGLSTTEPVAGLGGGVKYYLSRTSFLYVQAEYAALLEHFGDGIVIGGLGFGYRW